MTGERDTIFRTKRQELEGAVRGGKNEQKELPPYLSRSEGEDQERLECDQAE